MAYNQRSIGNDLQAKRRRHAGGVYPLRLCIHSGGRADLHLPVCERRAYFVQDRPAQVPAGHHLEARQRYLRHPADDPGQHLRHGGGYPRRRAHRPADRHLYVQVCLAPHQQNHAPGGAAAGGYPIGRVRLLRYDRAGARRAGHGQDALLQDGAPRQKRQGHEPFHRRRAAGHHDPAHHHHGQQDEPGRRSQQLL